MAIIASPPNQYSKFLSSTEIWLCTVSESLLTSQTWMHVSHSLKQIPLSKHLHQPNWGLAGGYGRLSENLDGVGSSCCTARFSTCRARWSFDRTFLWESSRWMLKSAQLISSKLIDQPQHPHVGRGHCRHSGCKWMSAVFRTCPVFHPWWQQNYQLAGFAYKCYTQRCVRTFLEFRSGRGGLSRCSCRYRHQCCLGWWLFVRAIVVAQECRWSSASATAWSCHLCHCDHAELVPVMRDAVKMWKAWTSNAYLAAGMSAFENLVFGRLAC